MRFEFELDARYDKRQSFYGKARVIENGHIITLQSYNTKILRYNQKTNKITWLTHYKDHFTQTTNRHINKFFKQYTQEEPKTKQELL